MMKMTPEEENRAKELRSDGLSYAKISEEMGLGVSKIMACIDPGYRERSAAYRKEHRAEILLQKAEYREANREELVRKQTAYIAEHREEERQRRKNHYQANRKEICKKHAIYYSEHREEIRESHRKYRLSHLAEEAAHTMKRRALKAGSMIFTTAAQKAEIDEIYRKAKEEPNIKCYLCNSSIPLGERHVDHIHPLSRGGKHTPSNLAVACATCNMRKHDKLPAELGLLL